MGDGYGSDRRPDKYRDRGLYVHTKQTRIRESLGSGLTAKGGLTGARSWTTPLAGMEQDAVKSFRGV
jgi:hypothetical protein